VATLFRVNVTSSKRRQEAVRAAVAVAARLGMPAVAPLVLKDSSHTSIHLSPTSVVARVVISTDADAPIVGPSTEIPPGPYFYDDAALTLWQFVSHHPASESDATSAAVALRTSHEALASYPGDLPTFGAAVDACYALLKDETVLAALTPTDRTFLLAEYDRLRVQLAVTTTPTVVLHGDPHLGNVLMTGDGPRWTDWESVCTGPLEGDLSCLPETALAASCGVNHDYLATLRCVSIWCWAHFDRAAEEREAAKFHLLRLRERARVKPAT
jgi:predicted trehalose synthase